MELPVVSVDGKKKIQCGRVRSPGDLMPIQLPRTTRSKLFSTKGRILESLFGSLMTAGISSRVLARAFRPSIIELCSQNPVETGSLPVELSRIPILWTDIL